MLCQLKFCVALYEKIIMYYELLRADEEVAVLIIGHFLA